MSIRPTRTHPSHKTQHPTASCIFLPEADVHPTERSNQSETQTAHSQRPTQQHQTPNQRSAPNCTMRRPHKRRTQQDTRNEASTASHQDRHPRRPHHHPPLHTADHGTPHPGHSSHRPSSKSPAQETRQNAQKRTMTSRCSHSSDPSDPTNVTRPTLRCQST